MASLIHETDEVTGGRRPHAKWAPVLVASSALLFLLAASAGGDVGLAAPLPASAADVDECPKGGWDWTLGTAYPRAIQDQAIVAHGNVLYSFGGRNSTGRLADSFSYSPHSDAWTAVAPLPEGRSFAASVTDGEYDYIVGGLDAGGSPTSSLYRYDRAGDSYTTLAPYTQPTYGHGAVYFDGKIYRIAGCTTASCLPLTATVEEYTIATNTWSPAASLPQAVLGPMAMSDERYLYAAGGGLATGGQSAKTYRYDPATNTWDDAGIADLPEGRSQAASGVLHGRWILAGGSVSTGPSTQSVVSWDPEANEWTYLSPLLTPRTRAGGAVIKGGFSLVGGTTSGTSDPTDMHQRYVNHVCPPPPPACNTQPEWQRGPYIAPDSSFVPGVTAPDGYFYVGTGESSSGLPVSRGLLRFNPATNNWQVLAQPLIATAAGALGAPAPGRIYMAAGWVGGTARVTNVLQIYDIAGDTWSLGAPMPVAPGREGSAFADFGGKLYMFGGDNGVFPYQGTSATYIYDPATDSWSEGASLPTPRTWFSAAAAGDFIYVYGGYAAVGQEAGTLSRYDPVADTWTELSASGHPIAYAGFSRYAEGTLLAAGGMNRIGTSWVTTNTTWLYDIATDTWEEGPRLNLVRGAMAQGALPDGRVIVHGGLYRPAVAGTVLGSTELLSPPVPCLIPDPALAP